MYAPINTAIRTKKSPEKLYNFYITTSNFTVYLRIEIRQRGTTLCNFSEVSANVRVEHHREDGMIMIQPLRLSPGISEAFFMPCY